jgi:hypothetical protein
MLDQAVPQTYGSDRNASVTVVGFGSFTCNLDQFTGGAASPPADLSNNSEKYSLIHEVIPTITFNLRIHDL